MVLTFIKEGYEDLPEKIREAVIQQTEKKVVIDETVLTASEIARMTNFLKGIGYKIT